MFLMVSTVRCYQVSNFYRLTLWYDNSGKVVGDRWTQYLQLLESGHSEGWATTTPLGSSTLSAHSSGYWPAFTIQWYPEKHSTASLWRDIVVDEWSWPMLIWLRNFFIVRYSPSSAFLKDNAWHIKPFIYNRQSWVSLSTSFLADHDHPLTKLRFLFSLVWPQQLWRRDRILTKPKRRILTSRDTRCSHGLYYTYWFLVPSSFERARGERHRGLMRKQKQ